MWWSCARISEIASAVESVKAEEQPGSEEERRRRLEAELARVVALQQAVAAAAFFLPPFELRQTTKVSVAAYVVLGCLLGGSARVGMCWDTARGAVGMCCDSEGSAVGRGTVCHLESSSRVGSATHRSVGCSASLLLQTVEDLRTLINATKETLLPKKKFAFSSKARAVSLSLSLSLFLLFFFLFLAFRLAFFCFSFVSRSHKCSSLSGSGTAPGLRC